MTKKALTLALEALEKERPYLGAMPALTSKAITEIKEALSELEQDDEVLGFNGWGFPIEKPSQPEQEPVAFFKTADLKAAWEAGYSAGRIAPLENKSTKVGTIGHIGDGKTTLTAAITPLLTEYKIGQEVKVTHLNHGGAVYNNKREIINANKQPHKTICIGRIVEIKQEGENGAVIVKCEGDDKFLPRFHFYPQDNGPDQIVEVLEQPKKSEPVGEILLSCGDYKEVSWKKGKLPPVGTKLYTTPPQRKPLTDEQIRQVMINANLKYDGFADVLVARAIEAAHGIKE